MMAMLVMPLSVDEEVGLFQLDDLETNGAMNPEEQGGAPSVPLLGRTHSARIEILEESCSSGDDKERGDAAAAERPPPPQQRAEEEEDDGEEEADPSNRYYAASYDGMLMRKLLRLKEKATGEEKARAANEGGEAAACTAYALPTLQWPERLTKTDEGDQHRDKAEADDDDDEDSDDVVIFSRASLSRRLLEMHERIKEQRAVAWQQTCGDFYVGAEKAEELPPPPTYEEAMRFSEGVDEYGHDDRSTVTMGGHDNEGDDDNGYEDDAIDEIKRDIAMRMMRLGICNPDNNKSCDRDEEAVLCRRELRAIHESVLELQRMLRDSDHTRNYMVAENNMLRRRQEERQALMAQIKQEQDAHVGHALQVLALQQQQLMDQQRALLSALKVFSVAFEIGIRPSTPI